MVDKLSAAESTFKEMQLRMGDPAVAGNATEFQRVAKAAADLEGIATAFGEVSCPGEHGDLPSRGSPGALTGAG